MVKMLCCPPNPKDDGESVKGNPNPVSQPPCLVGCVLFSWQWMVVSWIDSKAMFGDEHTFVKEHQSQLLSYVNRQVAML